MQTTLQPVELVFIVVLMDFSHPSMTNMDLLSFEPDLESACAFVEESYDEDQLGQLEFKLDDLCYLILEYDKHTFDGRGGEKLLRTYDGFGQVVHAETQLMN